MKAETSAGGIVVRKDGRSGWQVLLIRDQKGNWTFPKGIIEPGEDPVKAAVREIREESGVHGIRRLADLTPIQYLYTRGGLINKTVHYFLFRSIGAQTLKAQTEEGIQAVSWMPLPDAIGQIGYPKTNKPLLEEAVKKLDPKNV